MSPMPRNRRLANRIRSWTWENYTTDTNQVVFLGPRGEWVNVRHPIRGDANDLLAERADLLASGNLGAVVYLSPAPYPWSPVQLALAEVYDSNGNRTVHTLAISPGTLSWSVTSSDYLDLWINQYREEDNRSTPQ